MKTNFLLLPVVVISFALFITGCGWGSENGRPHQHKPGDTYCTYEVKAVNGPGAIPVGSTICIYCPDPFKQRCDPDFTMDVAEGISYDLKRISNSCTLCPPNTVANGWTYKLVE